MTTECEMTTGLYVLADQMERGYQKVGRSARGTFAVRDDHGEVVAVCALGAVVVGCGYGPDRSEPRYPWWERLLEVANRDVIGEFVRCPVRGAGEPLHEVIRFLNDCCDWPVPATIAWIRLLADDPGTTIRTYGELADAMERGYEAVGRQIRWEYVEFDENGNLNGVCALGAVTVGVNGDIYDAVGVSEVGTAVTPVLRSAVHRDLLNDIVVCPIIGISWKLYDWIASLNDIYEWPIPAIVAWLRLLEEESLLQSEESL